MARNTYTHLAGRRPEPVVSVDYADVLRQAVENERWRVLREVRRALDSIATTEPNERSYGMKDRPAEKFKRDLTVKLDAIEREVQR